MLARVFGSAAAGLAAMLFFMLTAFGGGGLVASGRRALSKAVERYLNASLLAGPAACALLGALPWFGASPFFYFAPYALLAGQVVLLMLFFRK